jgi:citrate synthase
MASSSRTTRLTAQTFRNCNRTPSLRNTFSPRLYSSSAEPSLKEILQSKIPEKRELLKQVKSHADKKLGEVKVASALGGMRGLKAMIWEGSVLDANEGIRFHGKTIKDCQAELPKGKTGTEMLPEAMFWLLLTGDVPTEGQVRALSREWAAKAQLPKHVEQMLDNFPPDLHPMTQFSCAVSALNYNSAFAKMYEKGMNKADYWEPTFDDSMDLLAKLPVVAAKIYQNAYRGGGALPAEVDLEQDWSYNFAAMLGKGGKDNEGFQDLLRLYLALHGDHEGGNVSAHATHLVGSALSDPYLSYSAGLQGLAGPLHGLAAQEVVRWIIEMQKTVGEDASEDSIKEYLWTTLKAGRVIPGYGHGVLRQPDPRFQALLDFAAQRPEVAEDPLVKLVIKNSQIAPGVLKEHGKVSRDVEGHFLIADHE